LATTYGLRPKISIQINPQRSQTREDTDLLGSQKTLVKKYFSWNYQKDE